MNSEKPSSKSAGAGLLVAVTASLCCITPVLALISGTSGIAAIFSWLEPFRPYLIGLTVMVLLFAWYQKLKQKKTEIDCECEDDERVPFMQSKFFLGLVTIFAAVMLAFPYYSDIFYPDINKESVFVNESSILEINLAIEGMTCTGCEEHINYEVNKLTGVMEIKSSFQDGQALIKYDASKTSIEDIVNTINDTGYTVKEEFKYSGGNKSTAN